MQDSENKIGSWVTQANPCEKADTSLTSLNLSKEQLTETRWAAGRTPGGSWERLSRGGVVEKSTSLCLPNPLPLDFSIEYHLDKCKDQLPSRVIYPPKELADGKGEKWRKGVKDLLSWGWNDQHHTLTGILNGGFLLEGEGDSMKEADQVTEPFAHRHYCPGAFHTGTRGSKNSGCVVHELWGKMHSEMPSV
jgi:hypothetical protein